MWFMGMIIVVMGYVAVFKVLWFITVVWKF